MGSKGCMRHEKEDEGPNTEPVCIFGKGSREITRCSPRRARDHGEQGAWEQKEKTRPNEEETVKTASRAHLRAGETAHGESFLILGTMFNGTTCWWTAEQQAGSWGAQKPGVWRELRGPLLMGRGQQGCVVSRWEKRDRWLRVASEGKAMNKNWKVQGSRCVPKSSSPL